MKERRAGYLLVELIVFVTVLAILAGVFVPRLMKKAGDIKTRAEAQRLTSLILTLMEAGTAYVQDTGQCPTSQQDLVTSGYLKATLWIDVDGDGVADDSFQSNANRGWGGTGVDCVIALNKVKTPLCEKLVQNFGTAVAGVLGTGTVLGNQIDCNRYASGTQLLFFVVAADIQ